MANAYDEVIQEYGTRRNQTQTDINNLAVEKQNMLDTYEQNYNDQINNYNDLMNQQQNYIDTWANTQRETQQKQTDFNVGLIEQAKQDAEKKTNAEIGNAYIDYQRGLNQFGGSAETLASQGLGGTGFAKNQDIAMNITYQNRVASAKSALQKANVDYNNQIQQALLTNDAALAEVALKQMQQSYALALQGFEYKTTMQNNRLNYIQGLNDSYFNKTNTLQSRYDSYMSAISNTKIAKEQQEEAARQAALNRSYRYSGGGSGTGQQEFSGGSIPTGSVSSAAGGSGSVLANLAGANKSLPNAVGKAATQLRNALSGTKYTAKSNPVLSSKTASNWYNKNIGGKSFSASAIKSTLQNAYSNGDINANDVKNILKSYGLE